MCTCMCTHVPTHAWFASTVGVKETAPSRVLFSFVYLTPFLPSPGCFCLGRLQRAHRIPAIGNCVFVTATVKGIACPPTLPPAALGSCPARPPGRDPRPETLGLASSPPTRAFSGKRCLDTSLLFLLSSRAPGKAPPDEAEPRLGRLFAAGPPQPPRARAPGGNRQRLQGRAAPGSCTGAGRESSLPLGNPAATAISVNISFGAQ